MKTVNLLKLKHVSWATESETGIFSFSLILRGGTTCLPKQTRPHTWCPSWYSSSIYPFLGPALGIHRLVTPWDWVWVASQSQTWDLSHVTVCESVTLLCLRKGTFLHYIRSRFMSSRAACTGFLAWAPVAKKPLWPVLVAYGVVRVMVWFGVWTGHTWDLCLLYSGISIECANCWMVKNMPSLVLWNLMQSCEGLTQGIRREGQYMAEKQSVPFANIMAGWAGWTALLLPVK